VIGKNINIDANNTNFSAGWDIKTDGSASVSSISNNLGMSSLINIQDDSTLTVFSDGSIKNTISGSGVLDISLENETDALSFRDTYDGTKFSGIIALNKGTININNDEPFNVSNLSALNGNAVLSLGSNGVLETSGRKNTIGDVSLDGGTINVGLSTGNHANYLTVDNLSLKGGTIFINTDNIPGWNFTDHVDPGSPINPTDNFLNQANSSIDNKMLLIGVNGDKSSEAGTQIHLDYSSKGNTGVVSAIIDNDGYKLNTTYDYTGLMVDNQLGDGIYLNYVLTEIEMEKTASGDPGRLLITTNGTDASKFINGNFGFGAKISGEGDVTYVSNSGERILVQAANDYVGNSTAWSGTTLVLGNDNALGQTALLDIQNNSSVALAGHEQTIKNLQNLGGFNLGSKGILNIIGDTNISPSFDNILGKVSGTGELNFVRGTTIASENNDVLAANISIGSQANSVTDTSVHMKDLSSLGYQRILVNTSGELILSGLSGLLSNQLIGDGVLLVADNSEVTLANINKFNGDIIIDAGNSNIVNHLTLNNIGNSTKIQNDGDLTFDVSLNDVVTLTENNIIAGRGSFNKNGLGTLVVETNLAYRGETNVNDGELWFNGSDAELLHTNLVNIAANATVSGYGTINGDVINNGSFIVGREVQDASINQVNTGKFFTVKGDFKNTGVINLLPRAAKSVLMIVGDYVGNGGDLKLATQLGDDSSPTQLVSINGNALGNTSVYVTNVGGLGAQTTQGIKIIEVAGHSEIEAFSLKNTVVAGNYEYLLQRSGENWVL